MNQYLLRRPWPGLRAVRLFLLVFAVVCQSAAVPAQRRQQPAPPSVLDKTAMEDLRRIEQASLASDFAFKQVEHLSYNIGPRLSGSLQAAKAVEYVSGEMRKLGLDVRLEKVMVPHWVRGVESGALTEWPGMAPGTTQKVVLAALGGSVATPDEGITAEVVVVKNFAELSAMDQKQVEGKIVLFNHEFDKQMAAEGQGGAAYGQAVQYRGGGPGAAAAKGAIACLVRSAGASQNRLVHTGATFYPEGSKKIPAATVSNEDAQMMGYLAAQGPLRMHLVLTPKTLPDAESANVIADLKGSEHPEQIVIVSGHLDSWDLGMGSIDDGAGVVVAMQTMQVIKALRLKPKRTIRFIAWMNEENGTRGGRGYSQDEKDNIANHYAAIESDLGAGHPLGFSLTGNPDALPLLGQISEVLTESGAGLSRTVEGGEADISFLAGQGVPSFGIWQDSRYYFNYHHTAADTPDKINPRELAENATVMAVLAYGLATMDGALPRVPPPAAKTN
jgi:carboxypeptidase Q